MYSIVLQTFFLRISNTTFNILYWPQALHMFLCFNPGPVDELRSAESADIYSTKKAINAKIIVSNDTNYDFKDEESLN